MTQLKDISVTVYSQTLMNLSKAVLVVAMLIIAIPETYENDMRSRFPEYSAYLYYLFQYFPLVLIAISGYMMDRATKGTWWRKNSA